MLVVGEPGIGKTTLLRELSDLAANAGLTVGYGRGEPEGAAPLWPWTSALGTIVTHDSGPALDGGVSRFAVFDRLRRPISEPAPPRARWHWSSTICSGPTSRHCGFFAHLLDRPSLPGVLVAAGLRTTEPLADEAAEVVSGLLAHPSVEVVELSAFDEAEITAFADERLARRPSDDEVVLLARRSGGNPFFLGELLRWIPAADSPVELDAVLPLAVRESVRRRLVVEDGTTQTVVKAAAVAGSAATLKLLATVTGLDRVEVGRALDSADRAGMVAVEPSRRGSVTFVHDLVRQVVLSLLPTWSRIELHHAVGMALHDDVRSTSWTVVTAHLMVARPLVDDVTLADVAHRAAIEATRAGAFDEAADHLAVALELTAPPGDTAERGELLLERGRALWAAERADESTAALGEAAGLARRTGNIELLARVALSWRGGELRAINRRVGRPVPGLAP